jgi:hypothetical protein
MYSLGEKGDLLRRLIFTLSAVLLLMSSYYAIYSVRADVARIPGVKAGDFAKYDFIVGYFTNDPNPPIPPPPPEYKQIEFYKIQVQSVVGTVINYDTVMHYLNGTESTTSISLDLNGVNYSPTFIIAANLTAGDSIYNSSDSPKINATLLLTYAGAARQVNYVDTTSQSQYPPSGYTASESMQLYWDKLSGIVVEAIQEINMTNIQQGYVTHASIHLIMNETNIWGLTPPAMRVLGVKAGDWAKYAASINYTTDDPNPPVKIPEIEDLEYYKVTILSVVGTNVTYETLMHFRNGTEMSMPNSIDVSSGEMDYGAVEGFGPVIAANLTAGDKVYLNQFAPTLNTTEMGTYAGSQREVNCLHMRQNLTYPYSTLQQYFEFDFCWDKASGIFVAINETLLSIDSDKGYTTFITIKLAITETNIWNPTPTIAARVFIAPRVINLKSNGKWILALIELPCNYSAKDVDLASIKMNGTISVAGKAIIIAKHWLLVKFNRSEVSSYILSNVHLIKRLISITLTITGKLKDGSIFQGSDKIVAIAHSKKATMPSDIDGDHMIGPEDFACLLAAYGSTPDKLNWNPDSDIDGDGRIGPADFALLSTNFGKYYS